jgi:hypothetical protein
MVEKATKFSTRFSLCVQCGSFCCLFVPSHILKRHTFRAKNGSHTCAIEKETRSRGKVTSPVQFKESEKLQKRVAEAALVSERAIRRILKNQDEQEEQDTSFGTSGEMHRTPKRFIEIDTFDKYVVRRTSHILFAKKENVQLLKHL